MAQSTLFRHSASATLAPTPLLTADRNLTVTGALHDLNNLPIWCLQSRLMVGSHERSCIVIMDGKPTSKPGRDPVSL
jgi:hypothetical protein